MASDEEFEGIGKSTPTHRQAVVQFLGTIKKNWDHEVLNPKYGFLHTKHFFYQKLQKKFKFQ